MPPPSALSSPLLPTCPRSMRWVWRCSSRRGQRGRRQTSTARRSGATDRFPPMRLPPKRPAYDARPRRERRGSPSAPCAPPPACPSAPPRSWTGGAESRRASRPARRTPRPRPGARRATGPRARAPPPPRPRGAGGARPPVRLGSGRARPPNRRHPGATPPGARAPPAAPPRLRPPPPPARPRPAPAPARARVAVRALRPVAPPKRAPLSGRHLSRCAATVWWYRTHSPGRP
mmetsp:Transcript_22317/g.62647  ORF Transcript_22317/g.62647 Transcript_22317/m.62647 type:complete len:232 (+) Transcript_22317:299-994(+)